MIAWAAVVEFIKNNKWLVFLALLVFLIQGLGNTIVSSIAYFQPKVTIIQQTVTKISTADRSVTSRHEIDRPDGTKEIIEDIHTIVDSMNYKVDGMTSVKEPVSLGGSGLWSPWAAYAPWQRQLSVGVGYSVGQLTVGLAHPVFTLDNGLNFPSEFAPLLWGSWRL